jgi:hypothetical protein
VSAIARRAEAEAIQTVAAARFWIASLQGGLRQPRRSGFGRRQDTGPDRSVGRQNEQKSGANDLFRFDSATSHEGNVDKRLIVINATLLRTNFARITAVATGYDCAKYRLQIFQGMAIRYIFVLDDGSPAGDFLIDRSKC